MISILRRGGGVMTQYFINQRNSSTWIELKINKTTATLIEHYSGIYDQSTTSGEIDADDLKKRLRVDRDRYVKSSQIPVANHVDEYYGESSSNITKKSVGHIVLLDIEISRIYEILNSTSAK